MFFILVIGLGWIISYVYDVPDFLWGAALFSSLGAIVSYWFSDSITLSLAGAREIAKKSDFPELYRIVENLCIAAGLPTPRIFVLDEQAPNAFATGRDKDHAAIAVTRGLLEMTDKQEAEAVIAHELSHIGNRDTLYMTAVVILAGLVSVLSNLFMRMQWFGNRRGRDRDNEGQNIMFLVGLVVSLLAPIAALLIRLAISRRREFLADANAVLLTRYPDGLISALRKIQSAPAISQNGSTAIDHLYFASQFGADRGAVRNDEQNASWYATLFSTHPSIQQRIDALKKM